MTLPQCSGLPSVYLKPGEVYICEEPTKVVTVLGSCVSVTMFNKRLRTGAICHGTLPQCRQKKTCSGFCTEALKFVDCSIKYMLFVLNRRGIKAGEIEVKVFGGADTLASRRENTIGSENVKTALGIIEADDLKVTAADVGDSFGRKLIFFSHTGEVFLKRLKNGTRKAEGA